MVYNATILVGEAMELDAILIKEERRLGRRLIPHRGGDGDGEWQL
jgi:hypothetical protein